jgi:hypothetical protein
MGMWPALANHGIMTVIASILAPDFPFPNQPIDVQQTLLWVYQTSMPTERPLYLHRRALAGGNLAAL